MSVPRSRTADASEEARPRGRSAVTEAILDAATELFATRGTAAVSIREIAAEAGVNHGLIHRHFGGKPALVLAVHNRLAERLAPELQLGTLNPDGALALHQALARDDAYWRVLARVSLDGELEEVLRSRLPVTHELVERLAEVLPAGAPVSAEDLVAVNLAFSLGWMVFEDFIRAATGADGDVPAAWFALQGRVVATPTAEHE